MKMKMSDDTEHNNDIQAYYNYHHTSICSYTLTQLPQMAPHVLNH